MWPIDRLLRSLREHRQYTPEDSKWVCIGYAPYARHARAQIAVDSEQQEPERE
jgi:hypothetical protein